MMYIGWRLCRLRERMANTVRRYDILINLDY